MLNNTNIVKNIREFGKRAGLMSDAAICKQCKISNRMVFDGIVKAKTTPQLGTIAKFADGLNVQIEDLIYNRTDADREIARLLSTMTEYEKTEVVVYIKMMQKEKNQEQQRMVA